MPAFHSIRLTSDKAHLNEAAAWQRQLRRSEAMKACCIDVVSVERLVMLPRRRGASDHFTVLSLCPYHRSARQA